MLYAAIAQNLGGLLLDMKQPSRALRMYRQALRHHQAAAEMEDGIPDRTRDLRRHHHAIAKTLLVLARHADAAQAVAILPEILPVDWASYHDTAHVLSGCADVASKDPALSEVDRQRAVGKYTDDSVKMLRDTVRLLGDDAAGHRELATCSLAGKILNAKETLAHGEKAAQLAPKRADSWGLLANLYNRAGRKNDAIVALEKALALDTQAVSGWHMLAVLRAETGDSRGAITAMKESNRLQPHAKRMFFLAIHHGELGDRKSGRVWYNRAQQENRAEEHTCEQCRALMRKAARILDIDPGEKATRKGRR